MGKLESQFTDIVKYKNPFTPNIISYTKIKNGIAEISSGKRFGGGDIFGVTVIINNEHNHDLSDSFHSIEEVNNYIKKLKNKKNGF
jgi:hypothetical protein